MAITVILGTVVLLLASIVLSHIHLSAAYGPDGAWARVRWLGVGGAFCWPSKTLSVRFLGLRLYRGRLGGRAKDATDKKAPKRAKRKKRKESSPLRRWQSQTVLFGRLCKRLLASVRLEHVHLNATLASPDPAWTGAWYGWASALVAALQAAYPHAPLALHADFVGDTPEIDAGLALRVRVGSLLGLGWLYLTERRRLQSKRSATQGGFYGRAGA